MLFKKRILEGIQNGAVTLAFRRWRRPTVKGGGSLMTPVGKLHIESVTPIALETISEVDARQAGHESREALMIELSRREHGQIYRIQLGALVPDPRIALRASPATGVELQELRKRLNRLDSYADSGAWTFRVLEVLNSHSGVRAGDICGIVGQDKEQFKRNVRKLKNLGLTESLSIGYRLSPRGEALLDELRKENGRETT